MPHSNATNPSQPVALAIASVEARYGSVEGHAAGLGERRYGFPAPARDAPGKRVYPPEQVDKLRTLRRLLVLQSWQRVAE